MATATFARNDTGRDRWFVTDLRVGAGQDPLEVAQDYLNDEMGFQFPIELSDFTVEEQIRAGHVGDEFDIVRGWAVIA